MQVIIYMPVALENERIGIVRDTIILRLICKKVYITSYLIILSERNTLSILGRECS